MAESLKLGLVGADASGRGWGPVAQQGKLSGTSYGPDFDHAVELHRPLDTIEHSSDEGRSIAIDPTADTGRT